VAWLIAGSLIPTFLVACLAAAVVRRCAAQFGLVDQPGERKVHEQPIPLGGGVAIWLGVVLPIAVGHIILWSVGDQLRDIASAEAWQSLAAFADPHLEGLRTQTGKLWLLLGGGTMLMLLGLVDDLRGLDWKLRIAIQLAVAIATVAAGWRMTLFVDLPWLTATVSVLWIVGLINTFNMLDNMDGLSAGVATIAATILAAVIFLSPETISTGPQLFVGGLLLVLVGSLLGFLVHNRPPAKLFMGDAGSYFVGYVMATATISATFAGEGLPRHAVLSPLCVLAIPLYDTISVIAIRLKQGRSPFEADKCHISHRLVDLGFSKPQAVLVIYAATFACGLGALTLHRVNTFGAIVVLVLVAAWLGLIALIEAAAVRKRRANSRDKP